jgi:hypothetical protein
VGRDDSPHVELVEHRVVAASTRAGQYATEQWVDQSINGSTSLSRGTGTVMAMFSALWTPDTYQSTVRTLIGAKAISKALEGVYEFIGTDGNLYVGQSGDIAARMEQHVSSGKLDPDAEVNVTPVEGGRTQREIVEQRRIDQQGGVENERVSNQRNPVGPRRKHLMRDQE